MGLLVGGVLAQHLLPAALRAHHREAALAQPRARAQRPVLVGVVGQQLTAVGRVVAAFEALDIGGHLGGRGQLHHSAAEHDRAAVAQRAARIARGLVQVRRGSIDAQLRPEHLEHLVARHAMAGSERKQLHEIRRAPLRPRIGRDGSRVDERFEASEQSDLELTHEKPTIPPHEESLCAGRRWGSQSRLSPIAGHLCPSRGGGGGPRPRRRRARSPCDRRRRGVRRC